MSTNIKILIGDNGDTKNFSAAIKNVGFEAEFCGGDGNALIEQIRLTHPDVVVCDAIMPGADAVEVLKRVNSLNGSKPFFIVTLEFRNTYVEKQVMAYQNAYVLLEPFDADTLISVIQHVTVVSAESMERSSNMAHMEMIVTDIIHQIGIPAHIKGYHYLREAIMLAVDDSDMLESVTKQLYPAVARRFETSPSRVERAIRHAIETAWDRGDVDTLNNMFGYTINGVKGKPTNSEFIALITDNLRLRYKLTAKNEKKPVRRQGAAGTLSTTAMA